MCTLMTKARHSERIDDPSIGLPWCGEQWAQQLDGYGAANRNGYYPQLLPFIPGLEGAGIVEAVAQDVRGLKVGDRVAYAGPTGGYSEVRLIEADRLVRLPGRNRNHAENAGNSSEVALKVRKSREREGKS
jgi:hypothetical protein